MSEELVDRAGTALRNLGDWENRYGPIGINLRPILEDLKAEAERVRDLILDQRLHGKGPHSQEWWDGAQYILEELAARPNANE